VPLYIQLDSGCLTKIKICVNLTKKVKSEMKYRNKKIKIVILGIIFAISLFSIQNFSDKEINTSTTRLDEGKLGNSEGYDPAGLIALWSGPLDTIPNGWKLCNGSDGTPDTSDRFISFTDSMEEPGASGGSTSHDHRYTTVPLHDHGETSDTSAAHEHHYLSGLNPMGGSEGPGTNLLVIVPGETGSESTSHSHGVGLAGASSCYTSAEENVPPFYELAFIEKETNDPVIPTGLIVMWAGNIEDIPVDWALCNGTNGTPDLRDSFIRGVNQGEDPGISGGNDNHNHVYTDIPEHIHTIAGKSHSHVHRYQHNIISAPPYSGGTSWLVNTGVVSTTTHTVSAPHTHTMSVVGQPTCTTDNNNTLPPYYKTAFIMNKIVTDALPMGSIAMWGNLTADIPLGWNQCNGTNSTPDMRNNFIRGVATGEQPGITGGEASHRHSYSQVPLHSHSIFQDSATHSHPIFAPGLDPFLITVSAPVIYTYDLIGRVTFSDSFHHTHDILPTGSAVCYTEYESNLPPFIKLKCIQKRLFIANPSPNDGATNIDYSPILSVDVFDYDGDDLTVTFYNASDNDVIGIDAVSGGTGTASISWPGCLAGTLYSWNITVDDGVGTINSDTWAFTTNYIPNEPINPSPNDGTTNIDYSPTLSVDVFDYDGDDLTVTFYNASDNSVIEIDTVSGGSGVASVTWSGLPSNTTVSWYVIVDDGLSLNQSLTWTFTTLVWSGGGSGGGGGSGSSSKEETIPGYSLLILLGIVSMITILLAKKRWKLTK